MPADEHTRAEYLRALLNQKKAILNQSGSLLNPSVTQGSELQVVDAGAKMGGQNQERQERDWWQRIWDTADEFLSNVTGGIVDFVDSIGDTAIYVAGGIGSLFGADTQWAQDAINYDWNAQAVNALNQISLSNVFNGDLFNGRWADDWASVGSAEASRNKLDQIHQNSYTSELGDNFNKYYQSITQGIGNVLPSIALGIVTGGSSTGVQIAVGGGSALLQGFGASTEEALGEGATYGQAGAAGLVGGAIEAGTELASMGIAKGIGAASSKLAKGGVEAQLKALSREGLNTASTITAHILGRAVGKEVSELTVKEIVSEMVEEGAEEWVSEMLRPLIKSTYQGSEAFDEWWDSDKRAALLDDAAVAFVGGAAGGAFGAFVAPSITNKMFEKEGQTSIQAINEINKLNIQEAEILNSGNVNQSQIEQIRNTKAELVKAFGNNMAELRTKHPAAFKRVVSLLNDPQLFKNKEFRRLSTSDQMDFAYKQITNSFSENGADIIVNNINNMYQRAGLRNRVQFVDNVNEALSKGKDVIYGKDNSVKGYIDRSTGDIFVSRIYENEIGALVRHEGISHAILDSNKTIRDNLSKAIEEDKSLYDKFHSKDEQIKTTYKVDEDSEVFKSEQMASFLEDVLFDQKKLAKVFGRNALTKSNLKTILNRIKNYINLNKNDTNTKILKAIDQSIEYLKQNNNMYFRDMSIETDNDGNRLTKAQQEFFKDSKARDDDIRFSKDPVVGRYELGDNKLKAQVRKVSNGYDIYEQGKLVKEGLTREQVQQWQKDSLAKKVNTAVEERVKKVNGKKVKTEVSTTKKVVGNWLLNDGKDTIRVEYNQGKYQIFQRKGILTEFENIDDVRNYMAENKAVKETFDSPTKLREKQVIRFNTQSPIFVKDSDGVIFEKRIISQDGKFSVRTKNLDSGEVFTNDFKSWKEAVNSIDSFTNKSMNKENLMNKEVNKETVKQVKATEEFNKRAEKVEENSVDKKGKNVHQTSKVVQSSEESLVKKASRKIANRLSKSIQIEDGDVTVKMDVNKIANVLATAKNVDVAMEKINTLFNEAELSVTSQDGSSLQKMDFQFFDKEFDIKSDIKGLLEAIQNPDKVTELNTKMKALETSLRSRANEMKARISEVKQINYIKKDLLKSVKSNLAWNKDTVSYHMNSLLLEPFFELDAGGLGYTAHQSFITAIDNVLENYTEENLKSLNSEHVQVDPVIRDMFEEIKESLPKAKDITFKSGEKGVRYSSLDSNSLKLIKNTLKAIKHLNDTQTVKYRNLYAPAALSTADTVLTLKDPNGKFFGLLNKALDNVSERHAQIRNYLGDSELAKMCTTGINEQISNKDLYVGDWYSAEKEFIKNNNLKRVLGKTTTFNGYEIRNSQLADLYNTLTTKENFELVDKYGLGMFDKKGVLKTLIEKGQAEKALVELKKVIPENVVKYANWTKEQLNGSIKEDYVKWYKNRYGIEPNEISDYWQLNRVKSRETSVENSVKSFVMFKRSISRQHNTNMVELNDAKSVFEAYVNQLGIEIYVKPAYNDIIQTLNNAELHDTLLRTIGLEKLAIITDTMDEIAGKKFELKNGFASKLAAGYTLKNLSFNLSTASKQFLSLFTSNLPMNQSIKGIGAKIFKSQSFVKAYNQLSNEIGSIKYRSGVIGAETADTNLGKIQKVSEFGMGLVTGMDKVTIRTGLATLMVMGKEITNSNSYNTVEVKNFVKSHWNEFILTQIGSGALSQNNISRSNGIGRYIFGYMQGANRAAVSSQEVKLLSYFRNKGLNEIDIKNDIKEAKKNVNKLQKSYDSKVTSFEETQKQLLKDNGSFKKLLENDTYKAASEVVQKAEADLIKAKSELSSAQNSLTNFQEYKMMGGKKIPLHMAAGLFAQGMLLTLINEVFKHIRGKKDWDDWFGKETIPEILLNSTVGWIPVANVVVNSIVNNYDIEIASSAVITDLLDLCKITLNCVKGEGNTKELIKTSAEVFSSLTGVPVTRFFNDLTGIVNMFDGEAALGMQQLLYSTSYNGMIEKLKETGKPKYMNYILDNYKVKNSNETTRSELLRLYNAGFKDAMPKNYASSYTVDGVETDLSDEQIATFRGVYDISSGEVNTLLSIADYKGADDETKSKLISKVYSTYYEVAKAKTLGSSSGLTKVGKLLYFSNGKISIAKYVAMLNTLNNIEVVGNKTKKDLIIAKLNKDKSISKEDKLLLMYLLGYTMDEKNEKTLKQYFERKGVDKKIWQE